MLRLNLGCGLTAPPDWVNIDGSPSLILDRAWPVKRALHAIGVLDDAHMARWPRNVRRLDLRRPLPYPDQSADAVYSSHTLEHLYLAQAQALLGECRRVLRPGGILRLALPDAEMWMSEYAQGVGDPPGAHFNERLNAYPSVAPTVVQVVRGVFGNSRHRWQPTFDLVSTMLVDAGFRDIQRREYLEGKLPDLNAVEHRPDSLFVEVSSSHG
jgi:predicted SAM-dependent methyltransferase